MSHQPTACTHLCKHINIQYTVPDTLCHLQVGSNTPNFNRMVGNPLAKQIPWDTNPTTLAAWKEGNTGGWQVTACNCVWSQSLLQLLPYKLRQLNSLCRVLVSLFAQPASCLSA